MGGSKQLLVIAFSLVMFLIPNLVGLSLWYFGSGLPVLLRSLVAIMGWVVSFGASAVLFWRLVLVAFGTRVSG